MSVLSNVNSFKFFSKFSPLDSTVVEFQKLWFEAQNHLSLSVDPERHKGESE